MQPVPSGVGRGLGPSARYRPPTPHHDAPEPVASSVDTSHYEAREPAPGATRTRIRTLAKRVRNAGLKGALVAMIAGLFTAPALAQTRVGEGVPMNPVSVRVAQTKALGARAGPLTTLRKAHGLGAHQDRAAHLHPFIDSIPIPDRTSKLGVETKNALWRLITAAAHEAEGTPDLTNMIPTSPVKSTVVWRPTIPGADGERVDVLPLLLPHIANTDGAIDEAKLMALFSRVNNPSPSADQDDVFLAENVGYQNGRAGYFTFNAINPEPIQPFSNAGVMNLPQLILDVNGTKTVFTIGSLCYKGGGPSFKPSASSGYGYGYRAARKKTPLNEETAAPIYSGNTTFGLFDYEADAKANDIGWTLLDAGAYAGVSILQLKLDELVDYELDRFGKPVGDPKPIPVTQLEKEGRIAKGTSPSLLWRAFATEYRLSAFKSPEHGAGVLAHLQKLFARDAVFDQIANDPELAAPWAAATEAVSNGEDPEAMSAVFDRALDALNNRIRAGTHTLKTPVEKDADGVPTVTAKDYVRMAIQRSARNVVVLHKLGLVHRSIAAGGDNINAAWQMVDLDHLEKSSSMPKSPRDHVNVRQMVANLEMMIADLELGPFEVRDLLLQAIDREAPTFGIVHPDRT